MILFILYHFLIVSPGVWNKSWGVGVVVVHHDWRGGGPCWGLVATLYIGTLGFPKTESLFFFSVITRRTHFLNLLSPDRILGFYDWPMIMIFKKFHPAKIRVRSLLNQKRFYNFPQAREIKFESIYDYPMIELCLITFSRTSRLYWNHVYPVDSHG